MFATALVMLATALAVALPSAPAQPRQSAQKEAAERAATPYKAAKIMSLSAPELVKILEDDQAGLFEKAKACQRLAVVGDKSAVPALAALLSDPKLSAYARFGLEPNPDPSADAALRAALGKLDGKLLAGVINSIGRRQDPEAVQALARLRHSQDREVAEAASAALGRIRSPRAVRARRGPPRP